MTQAPSGRTGRRVPVIGGRLRGNSIMIWQHIYVWVSTILRSEIEDRQEGATVSLTDRHQGQRGQGGVADLSVEGRRGQPCPEGQDTPDGELNQIFSSAESHSYGRGRVT